MLTQIKEKAEAARQDNSGQILNWFQSQVSDMITTPGHTPNEEEEKERQHKEKCIMDLKQQQEDINRRLAELQGNPTPIDNTSDSQDMFIQQLRNALGNKKEEDPKQGTTKGPGKPPEQNIGTRRCQHSKAQCIEWAPHNRRRQQHGQMAGKLEQARR